MSNLRKLERKYALCFEQTAVDFGSVLVLNIDTKSYSGFCSYVSLHCGEKREGKLCNIFNAGTNYCHQGERLLTTG